MGSWWAGVDLGGTNVRAAAVDATGRLHARHAEPVDVSASAPFGQLAALVARLIREQGSPPERIGVGATGPLDAAAGTITNPWTLPASMQGDVRSVLEEAAGVPVVLENDADVAALAEAWLGAGRSARTLVCVTVGTGVGVGVVVDGRLHRGPGRVHPEAGHLVVDPGGPACYCGNHGCVESLASATALVTRTRALGSGVATAEDVVNAAAAGDAVSRRVVDDARRALVTAVRTLVAVHAADHVILTGGAVPEPRKLIAEAQRAVDPFVFAPPRGTRVTGAELGGSAGVIGAARLAMTT